MSLLLPADHTRAGGLSLPPGGPAWVAGSHGAQTIKCSPLANGLRLDGRKERGDPPFGVVSHAGSNAPRRGQQPPLRVFGAHRDVRVVDPANEIALAADELQAA